MIPCSLRLQPALEDLGCKKGNLQTAEAIADTAVSPTAHPEPAPEKTETTVRAIWALLESANRQACLRSPWK
jgi:hypothetical protein